MIDRYSDYLKEEMGIAASIERSGLQDSFLFRGISRARWIASKLLNAQGEVELKHVNQWIDFLDKQGFVFYQEGENDAEITEHLRRGLTWLKEDSNARRQIRSFHRPLCHSWAESLVQSDTDIVVGDMEIRQAVLSALLTPIRQSVGSCFATAPAIFIQKEQPGQFIKDLHVLLMTGKLKRIFDGIEYAVPMSPSTGLQDLRKPLDFQRAHFSPGLHLACEVAGLIPLSLTVVEKERAVRQWIELLHPTSAEELIHQGLLQLHQMDEKEFQHLRRLSDIHSRDYLGVSPDRIAICQEIRQIETRSKNAFKGLCEHPLLKVWEFTLASFSEVKMEFSKWNFYSSLGIKHTEEGGIGQVIYRYLEEKMGEKQALVKKFQTEYEVAYDQVLMVERLLSMAASSAEARRLQAEHQSRLYHMQSCLEMRDEYHNHAARYSQLYAWLAAQYDEQFPDYFQEIYDAAMQNNSKEQYDDSPAGFRLAYKHGRSDPAAWTVIDGPESYIQALLSFFSAVEPRLAEACAWKGGDQAIFAITSAILEHIQTPLFMETAMLRMVRAHAFDPIGNKTPWAYVSGGTMATLLKTYCCRSGEFTEESRWVENETELLIFLIDVLKHQSHFLTSRYEKDPYRSMLMTSPSHAFALRPGLPLFQAGWKEEGFTYTWIRDHVISPAVQFYRSMRLSPEAQLCLVNRCQFGIAQESPLSVLEWRQRVCAQGGTQQRRLSERIDALLYEALPLIPRQQALTAIRSLWAEKWTDEMEAIASQLLASCPSLLMADELQVIAKACNVPTKEGLSWDVHQFIADRARRLGLANPTPLLFADSNWSMFYFGFAVNPGTEQLELWRLNRTATCGVPMNSWKHWMNGQDKKNWSVYVRPAEYTYNAYPTNGNRI